MGIDEQRGHVGAVAGEGHEAVFGVGDWFFVGWVGVKGFHFLKVHGVLILSYQRPFLRAWVAAVRGSRKLRYSNSATSKRVPHTAAANDITGTI